MKLGFFIKEATRAMRRNAAPSFAALVAVVLTLIVVGTILPTVEAVRSADNTERHHVEVAVYMKTSANAAEESQTKQQLLHVQGVSKVNFETKAQAYAAQEKADPQAYSLLSSNPLPDTFYVIPSNPANALAIRSAIQGSHGKMLNAAIGTVSNHVSDTKKLLTITTLLTVAAIILSGLFIGAALLLIANTIRLSLYARRREVEVMKLVGATDWFIRLPFMIEGVLVGAAGALSAILLLGVAKFGLIDPLVGTWVGTLHTISFPALSILLILAGVVVSAAGSGLSLRRFLRV